MVSVQRAQVGIRGQFACLSIGKGKRPFYLQCPLFFGRFQPLANDVERPIPAILLAACDVSYSIAWAKIVYNKAAWEKVCKMNLLLLAGGSHGTGNNYWPRSNRDHRTVGIGI
jgi:hypothetical protein